MVAVPSARRSGCECTVMYSRTRVRNGGPASLKQHANVQARVGPVGSTGSRRGLADRAPVRSGFPGSPRRNAGPRHQVRRARRARANRPGLPRRARRPDPRSDRGQARLVLRSAQGRSTDPSAEPRSASVGRASMDPSNISRAAGGVARDSQGWIERLRATGAERDAALVELHALLLRAARFEVNRRRASSPHLRGSDYDDLAQQSADDALVAILRKLGDFRGDSRFTTWAYKFALYEAAANVRKRAWQGREIPLKAETWPLIVDEHQRSAQQSVEATDVLAVLGEAIESELTPHQREVLVAITLNGVPIDVLAERLNTTRGALYKTLHDARQKLRAALRARGLGIDADQESS